MDSKTPDRYGVIGHPVSHSLSPFIHGLFARETGQNLTYHRFDVAPEGFREWVAHFFAEGGRGLNVTVPHKPAAAGFATSLTERANLAGAVNTFLPQDDGGILGDNTDGTGLVRDLHMNLGLDLAGRRILLLGAGGAARGVIAPLLELAPSELVVINRTAKRAVELAERFGTLGPVRGCGIDELESQPFYLVINATSAGLRGEAPAPSPKVISARHTVCYDMSYGHGETPFQQWAQAAGSTAVHKGWGMLVEQAAESFELWRGVRPSTAPVLAVLTRQAEERLTAS